MMVDVINDRPPNFEDIARAFPQAHNKTVLFAYAPHIYAPFRTEPLPPQMIAHEQVHIARQEEIGVENWWARYLVDDKFRYEEELLAHRAEYLRLCDGAPNRNMRRSALKEVARKLASPLYGRMITVKKAMEDIAA